MSYRILQSFTSAAFDFKARADLLGDRSDDTLHDASALAKRIIAARQTPQMGAPDGCVSKPIDEAEFLAGFLAPGLTLGLGLDS